MSAWDAPNQVGPGTDCLYSNDSVSPHDFMVDPTTKTLIPRVATEEELAREARRKANIETRDDITGGFSSDALWAGMQYPSNPTDQLNMTIAAAVGGSLMCALNDVWELRYHTAEQARAVLEDFVRHRDALRQKLLS
jgi:hypothetical protein